MSTDVARLAVKLEDVREEPVRRFSDMHAMLAHEIKRADGRPKAQGRSAHVGLKRAEVVALRSSIEHLSGVVQQLAARLHAPADDQSSAALRLFAQVRPDVCRTAAAVDGVTEAYLRLDGREFLLVGESWDDAIHDPATRAILDLRRKYTQTEREFDGNYVAVPAVCGEGWAVVFKR
jgi:hypothetical protein